MIVIIGDSWGCGEWLWPPESSLGYVSHTGLEQYLKDANYDVVNLSNGGNQNSESLDALELYVKKSKPPKIVFWFVTCPLRTTQQYIHSNPYKFGIHQLNAAFEYASYLATQHNFKIYAIGGLCDLPEEIVKQRFDNVKIVIPSVSSILVDNFPTSMFGAGYELPKIKMKELALLVAEEIENKLNVFKVERVIFPDIGHPGREAHYKIFELVKPYLTNI